MTFICGFYVIFWNSFPLACYWLCDCAVDLCVCELIFFARWLIWNLCLFSYLQPTSSVCSCVNQLGCPSHAFLCISVCVLYSVGAVLQQTVCWFIRPKARVRIPGQALKRNRKNISNPMSDISSKTKYETNISPETFSLLLFNFRVFARNPLRGSRRRNISFIFNFVGVV